MPANGAGNESGCGPLPHKRVAEYDGVVRGGGGVGRKSGFLDEIPTIRQGVLSDLNEAANLDVPKVGGKRTGILLKE